MALYLKGFHLSLNSWRDGRDTEGWRVRPGQPSINIDTQPTGAEKPEDLEMVEVQFGLGLELPLHALLRMG